MEFIIRLVLAQFLGAAIGVERQWRQRMAGLRTNALVATGAATFVMLGSMIPGESSPTRVARKANPAQPRRKSSADWFAAGFAMRYYSH
jgi:uncharacterized membrane protein YhiD involved in acid resistance